MKMQGERLIEASRDDVWRALNDPEVLKYCVPGCDEMEKTSNTNFVASVVQKVGPVKARFKGSVELTNIVPGRSYEITGEGKGGAAGFARGGATVYLSDEPEGTLLSFEAEARVGGKLAQIGNRLIDGFARKMTEEFFDRFQRVVEGKDEDTPEDGETAEAESQAETGEKKKGWLKRMIG